ncbi:MAG: hypothetical protein AB1486_03835 [Planctomycetota bacterium]
MRRFVTWIVSAAALSLFMGCSNNSSSGTAAYNPDVDPSRFVSGIDNPLWPAEPGTTYLYEGETEDGHERIEVNVSHETRDVLGTRCTIVVDRVFVDGELAEETFDWYAQDVDGNVWYFGEDSTDYEDGKPASDDGSWEAGIDGALPGIVMKAEPRVGESYRQEFYAGHAEDMASVVALDAKVKVSYGTYAGCLQTKEWTPLEPGVVEYKYYAPGIGLLLETQEDGSEPKELVDLLDDKAPRIDPEDFAPAIDNPFLPLEPGTTFIFEGDTEDGHERIEVTVTHDTKEILGVTCTVVLDREYVDGELVEETYDWFAQDLESNVWYFGEDSTEYEDGKPVSKEGSWEAGVDGAVPGIVMKAEPRVGDSYRLEYYPGEAEDLAAVAAVDEPVSVAYGDFTGCLKTREWDPLEPGDIEYKFYAPGIGLVLETSADESELVELVSVEQE